MKYIIQVSELRSCNITVQANSREEAIAKANNDYYNNNFILTSEDDYIDGSVQFEVVSETT